MSSQLLQIFAKAPVLGQVKTRLAVDVGEHKACEVYQYLLSNTVKNTVSKDRRTELWCAPDSSNPFLQELASKNSVTLEVQPHGDIGERMLFALDSGVNRAENVVLIGTDCPVINSAYITAAFSALDTTDVVFGPVEDGGYILIGCNKVDRAMFKNISWSSVDTLEQNIEAVERSGLTYQILPELWDIDTHKDLRRWQLFSGFS